jgi:VIT1/CCC1 family predicted Fe2+/Mn2+ transporter
VKGIVLNHSLKVGFSFGLTSGIITTLGLMVGLHAGTHLKIAVVGGILTIAIADSFSDAIGIHVSEESECKHTAKEIWQSTLATFVSKFVFALSFLVPVFYFSELSTAIIVSVVWGLLLLSILSYFIARGQNSKPWKAVFEHLVIAVVVIILTHYTGQWISQNFC